MSTAAASLGGAKAGRYGLPLVALFGAFPLWWALGLGGFIWPLMAVPMLVSLVMRTNLKMPRGIGLWALFLMWVLLSAIQLDEVSRAFVFAYRYSLYLAAGIVFLYVYNAPRSTMPATKVGRVLAALWIVVVVGGLLGLVFQTFSFHSPTEMMMPRFLLADDWIHDMVHVDFAESVGLRPNAPFTYTNEWGANFALLTPFACLVLSGWQRRPTLWWPLLMVASFVPLVLSTNRGAWVSLGIGLTYGAVRLGLRGRRRALMGVLLLAGIIGALLFTTPLRTSLETSLSQRESTETRLSLYDQTRDAVLESPLFGYGAPRPSRDPTQPPLGTHGQFWMVAFSHGIPAAFLYVGFLLTLFWRTRRGRTRIEFFANVTMMIALVQLPFYGALPAQIFVIVVTAALALRERDAATTYERGSSRKTVHRMEEERRSELVPTPA